MTRAAELFADGRHSEFWQQCCGFIDLSLEDFMRIQRRLLMEQISLFTKCELGRRLMNGVIPDNLDDFRELVPLTTYDDYAPYFLKRRMDVLPKKPLLWQYTSGKTGEYSYRWVPVTARTVDEMEPLIYALMLFASCKQRGEVNIGRGDRFFYGMAPPPYATGTMTRAFSYEMFNLMPPLEQAERMSFEERMQQGFEMALKEGLDLSMTMSSLAVAIGRRFTEQSHHRMGFKELLTKDAKEQARLLRGLVKAKLARRSLLPKDLWNLKGLITFGIDGSVFREKIKDMWGCYPLDFHGCTEAMVIATQTWDHDGMTFVPNLQFLEFIPEEDALRSRRDKTFRPRTLLLEEVNEGNYELVITSFHGGPFLRYRLGHLIKITAMRNVNCGIDLPQMTFLGRIDDQIDIAGFTRLGEKVIWQAVENTGLQYEDWVACKEVEGRPILHLYLELKNDSRHFNPSQVARLVQEELKKLDQPYAELESFAGIHPLRITLLSEGAFRTYKLRQQAAGVDAANQHAPHVNPPREALEFLVGTATQVHARTADAVAAQ
jgi:hypothetical protein